MKASEKSPRGNGWACERGSHYLLDNAVQRSIVWTMCPQSNHSEWASVCWKVHWLSCRILWTKLAPNSLSNWQWFWTSDPLAPNGWDSRPKPLQRQSLVISERRGDGWPESVFITVTTSRMRQEVRGIAGHLSFLGSHWSSVRGLPCEDSFLLCITDAHGFLKKPQNIQKNNNKQVSKYLQSYNLCHCLISINSNIAMEATA